MEAGRVGLGPLVLNTGLPRGEAVEVAYTLRAGTARPL